ncbi:hypothetical protein D6B98_01550 [Bradyrhizobium sp. LVM 105]|nr:hypothetical protein D6B98_01550 [Bradyrhizobium sp. LVM 105]
MRRAKLSPHTPSLRAERSNPESFRGGILDCFVARAPRNDDVEADVRQTPLSCPGRSAASLRRCAAEPGPMSPHCAVPPLLCAAALHRPGHEKPTLPVGSRTPAARTDARPARS